VGVSFCSYTKIPLRGEVGVGTDSPKLQLIYVGVSCGQRTWYRTLGKEEENDACENKYGSR
jgi:hypothetical protein